MSKFMFQLAHDDHSSKITLPSNPLYLGFVLGQNLYKNVFGGTACVVELLLRLNCLKFLLTFTKKSISLIKLKIREAMV